MDSLTVDTAIAFYRNVTEPTAKSILDFLIDHPDERFNGRSIVEHLGLDRHSDVARSTYLMGQIAAEHGTDRPWTEGQHGYLLPGENADVLRQARDQAGRSAAP